jgi:uncharacterized protein YebE (UPF0316 family)
VSAPTGVLAGDGLVSGVVMAAMAMASVGLWTLRVTFAARGRKLLGAAVAAVEAVVFAMAFSNLAASLDAPVRVLGYACGVALGTVLGLYLDERATRGKSDVPMVADSDDLGLAETLRSHRTATSFCAEGPRGSVTVAFLGVDDAQVAQVVDALQESLPEAFWEVQELADTHSKPAPSTPIARRCARSPSVGLAAPPAYSFQPDQ